MIPRTLLLLSALLPAAALAQLGTEVIEPRHRAALELLPLLEAVSGPGSIHVYDNKLIVRATPAQLAEMRGLLGQFDRAARQLMISVRQGGVAERRGRELGVSGTYRRGDGSIVLPGPDGRLPRDVELQAGERQRRDDSGISQQVRTEEGREARIMLGGAVPYVVRERLPGGAVVQRSEYVDSSTGFIVLPRLQGDQVRLEIRTQQQTPQHGGYIDTRSSESIVILPLGEWAEIGGASDQARGRSSSLLGQGETQRSSQSSIQVRVDLLD
jgi:type II secretory pathway component GspD/PulD (secretin)